MLDRIFQDHRVIERLRANFLGSSLDDLSVHLAERGYSTTVIQQYACAGGHFAHWLESRRIPLANIQKGTIELFVQRHLPNCRCAVPQGGAAHQIHAALGHLLTVLREHHRISPEHVAEKGPIDAVIDVFSTHLLQARGITIGTGREYSRVVRKLLQAKYGINGVNLRLLTAIDLMDFVANQPQRCKQNITCAVRSFVRFLQLQGYCNAQLVSAVPSVPFRKLSQLPKYLTARQLDHLLQTFNRKTAIGRRNYAMVLCLAYLGLRAGEVAQLSIDDIDWRAGTVCVPRGKARRASILPLPAKVGQALVSYLRAGRPKTFERRVFVRHLTPKGAAIDGAVVRNAIRRAFERSGLNVPSWGTHVLRHTAGTLMVQRGASLKEIADVLRHRNINTTAIYAKVDLPTLASVSLPWPEVLP
jgi:integrase/recombinase XerD